MLTWRRQGTHAPCIGSLRVYSTSDRLGGSFSCSSSAHAQLGVVERGLKCKTREPGRVRDAAGGAPARKLMNSCAHEHTDNAP